MFATNFVVATIGILVIILAGINLRALGNGSMFAVSVMGHHANMRRFGLNALIYWMGTALVVVPAMFFFWELAGALLQTSGLELRLGAYAVSTICMASAIFNFYVFRVGPR